MAGKRLCTSILVGAIIGGAYALLDKGTRQYTKRQLNQLKKTSSYYVKNPVETIQKAQTTFNRLNHTVNDQADNAINALEQIEHTLDKVTKKRVKQIETK